MRLELSLFDMMLSWRPTANIFAPPITIITIADEDLTHIQHSAIPDNILATLLNNLLKQHPQTIGVDLYRDIPLPPGTKHLATLLNGHKEIIVAQKYGDAASAGIAPPPYLQSTEQSGCTDFPIDSDNRVRRALIFLGDNDGCFSFGFVIASNYLASKGIIPSTVSDNIDTLRLGNQALPRLLANDGGYRNMDNQGYQILFDFERPSLALRHYSLSDALANRIPSHEIENKIVLIGSVAESSKDFFAIADMPGQVNQQKTAGIYLHGLFIDQLLRTALAGQKPIKFTPEWLEWLFLGCCCFLGSLLASRKISLVNFVSLQILGLFSLASMAYIFLTFIPAWLPIISPALAWLFTISYTGAWIAHREHQQRNTLMKLFSSHVSGPIADDIWQNRHEILDRGGITPRRMTATVFFSDIVGFTPIAEKLAPETLIAWLNEYMDAITAVINQHNGVVIRFIGDAILAGFGVPIPRTTATVISQDAIRAATCALAIQNRLTLLNRDWASRNLPVITMRIGINTGPLSAGSLGSKDRLEYAIHGDTVNTAARLENYDKDNLVVDYFTSPCRILISDNTEQHLDKSFTFLPLGHVSLKGKSQGINVYRLISKAL